MPDSDSSTQIRYPAWLEDWWKSQALKHFRTDSFPDLQPALERDIQRLSDVFTTERDVGFGDYGRDESLLLAYGLFYFPQTFIRSRFPLREAIELRGWKPPANRPVRVLDLGAGMGSALLGVATCLKETSPAVEAVAVDTSAASLQRLRQLAADNPEPLRGISIDTTLGDLRSYPVRKDADSGFDLISASFSLGEAFFQLPTDKVHEWVKSTMRLLAPGGMLLLLEPALRETSEQLERLRDLVAAEKSAHILGPCPHHGNCPLLQAGKYWCHEVRSWPLPESLSFLNRRLFRSISELKFSFLLLSDTPAAPLPGNAAAEQTARLITPMSDMKGRFAFGGCAADGQRHDFEIQKRALSKNEQKELMEVERGDVFATFAPGFAGRSEIYRLESREQFRLLWSPRSAKKIQH